MRVQLDSGRKQVDLEYENGLEPFLYVVLKALESLDYCEQDILRAMGEFYDKDYSNSDRMATRSTDAEPAER